MSTHKVEVVPVVLQPHPNADTLSIVEVFGYTVCVRTADWLGKDRGAYIPPDSIVDTTRPEFSFLLANNRIKVKRLRGVISMGLLVPTDAPIGTDVMEALGVQHYEPPCRGEAGTPRGPSVDATIPPRILAPKYDVENARRYGSMFEPGEPVIVTEKIHGANGRWVFDGDKMHAGSRTEWKKEGVSMWWQVLDKCPWLLNWCLQNPGIVVYGEVFGKVQDLTYERDLDMLVFDLFSQGNWLDFYESLVVGAGLQRVPLLAHTTWEWPSIAEFAEGKSMLANHIREGCVVKPVIGRYSRSVGRVQAKIVGNGYLERV